MGGNAGVGKPFLAGVPLFGKIESLMPLSLGVSKPDGPGCNSPVQRAKHTPFFAIREWQKILVDRQRHKTF